MDIKPQGFENTGYVIPDAPDPRNFVAESIAPSLSGVIPTSFVTDITPFKNAPNIFFQGKQPSCVAHDVAWAVQYYYWKETGVLVKLSPRFLYALCKANDGIPDQEGTYLLTALKLAQKYGVCQDSYFPNDVNLSFEEYKDVTKIPQAAYDNAKKYRIGPYAFLSDISKNGLAKAIYQHGIVLIGMRIGQEWWTTPSGISSWQEKDILPLRPAKTVVSGHAVALYAYGIYTYLMNWWSYAWGYEGRGWFDSNDIPFIYEAAIITGLAAPTTPAPTPIVPDITPQKSSFWVWITHLLAGH